jgi:hypothetical protein
MLEQVRICFVSITEVRSGLVRMSGIFSLVYVSSGYAKL